MLNYIYLVRHCEAEGQAANAPLTERGHQQAQILRNFFQDRSIDRIISSPFQHAIQSIEPLAKEKNIDIEIENRLTEKILSAKSLSNWEEILKLSFEDLDLKCEGGESSREAQQRIVHVMDELKNHQNKTIIIVTHGNILSLLLHYINNEFGFDGWKKLKNPDVFLLTAERGEFSYKHLWE